MLTNLTVLLCSVNLVTGGIKLIVEYTKCFTIAYVDKSIKGLWYVQMLMALVLNQQQGSHTYILSKLIPSAVLGSETNTKCC